MPETLPILYRDDTIVAVDKPSGLLVHRSDIDRHETRFAVQIVRNQLGQHVWPAHRLDRGTSGVLLFALSPAVAGQIGQQFEVGSVRKRYLAVVRGHPPETGRIDYPLKRLVDEATFLDPRSENVSQPAITDFQRVATIELPVAVDRYPTSRYALLAVNPLTGRRHQIRRHLKHLAHPIIGDSTYGKGRHNRYFADALRCHRLLLACTQLGFTHPISGQRVTVNAPVSGEFAELLAQFGWASAVQ